MNRKLLLILALTLLAGMLSVASNVQKAEASGTIYIRADGSIDPPTAPISTLDNITYTLTGSITTDADGMVVERDNIVIDGAGYTVTGGGWGGSGNGITLTERINVTVGNMTIKNFAYGIWLTSSSNNTLSGNNVTANQWGGIVLRFSSNNNVLSGNNVANSDNGVYLSYSSNNTLFGNNVTANRWGGIVLGPSSNNNVLSDNIVVNNAYGVTVGYGIVLGSSSNNFLSGNVMGGNRYNFGVDGDALSDYLHSVDASNLVDGKPIYYFVNQSDMVVSADAYPEAGYLGLVNCANATVEGLNLTSNGQGILVAFTNDSKIAGNNVANNVDGVVLVYSSNNILSGNNVTANYCYGVVLDSSSNNTLSGNNIASNGYGINVYGICLRGSSGNSIYHNNFVDNAKQVYCYDSINVWDDGYPSGGNYWSSYAGVDLHSGSDQTDTGSDGIGDAPHVIDESNTDRYPLMAPYSTFDAGTWNETAYDVDVVSNSTVSDFHFNPEEGPLLEFNVTGQEGTAGFCRVAIPKDLFWAEDGQWVVLVGGVQIANYTTASDQSYTYLCFTYDHSTKTVQIQGTGVIPEFPSFLVLPLLFAASLLAVIAYKRKKPT